MTKPLFSPAIQLTKTKSQVQACVAHYEANKSKVHAKWKLM